MEALTAFIREHSREEYKFRKAGWSTAIQVAWSLQASYQR
jgi:hypothetical protein